MIKPNVERGNVFSKMRKQTKEVAESLLIFANLCKSRRSAADAEAAEQINRKNNGVDRECSPNAKTHWRCAADLKVAASAADLYSNR